MRIHKDSLLHNTIAKVVKMDGETEGFYAYRVMLMYGGVCLKQAFAGTGYNDQVRFYPGFGSRIYFMKAE